MEERTLLGVGFLLVVAFVVVVAAIGHPMWGAAGGVFAGFLLIGWGISTVLQARARRTDALGDNRDPIPVTSARPSGGSFGDDEQHHDELSPHDLPKDHPGRHEAEHQAAGDRFGRSDAGVTRGNT